MLLIFFTITAVPETEIRIISTPYEDSNSIPRIAFAPKLTAFRLNFSITNSLAFEINSLAPVISVLEKERALTKSSNPALNPYIGYENAAKTAKKAYEENISLKEACVALGFMTAEKFDEIFKPEEMV